MNKERYVDTIMACELLRDLEILNNGDLTEIGEKGINMSGGQKARISLARAVYADREIYLLDDPISAVDANVRMKLMQNVLMGCLSRKTRILVTHAIDFLHLADSVIVMKNGRIVENGHFSEIKDSPHLQSVLNVNKLNNESSKSAQKLQEMESEQPSAEVIRESEFEAAASDFEKGGGIQTIASESQVSLGQSVVMSRDQKLELFEKLGRVSAEDDGRIIKDENEEIIKVVFKSYLKLLKAGGGWGNLFILQFIMIGFVCCKILTDYTIGQWAERPIEVQKEELSTYLPLACYYVTGTTVFVLLRCVIVFTMGIKASIYIHKLMIEKVFGAPINLFFDVTPTGVILNRFSKDLQVLDNQIAFSISTINVMLYQLISVLAVIGWTNRWMLISFPFIFGLAYILFRYSICSYRECTRIESITRSPLLNLLAESYSGATTIRAFDKQNEFIEKNFELLNKNCLANQILMGTWCWFGIRMNILTVIIMIASTFVCILYRDAENKVLLAMVVQYILQLSSYVIELFYQLGELEQNMVSVQRCLQMLEVP